MSWLVCNYGRSVEFSIKSSTKQFFKARGKFKLLRHMNCHKAIGSEVIIHTCCMNKKRSLSEAATVSRNYGICHIELLIPKEGLP